MAEKKPNAAPRPNQGLRQTTTHSGVTHVRTYQSGHYTVVGNHLAQHRELSLTAIGLGTHILSLPEGAPVDIRSLADRFPEGRDRIAFALRELEAHGYLKRVRERTEAGRLFTRTYAHHTPGADTPPPASGRIPTARPRRRSVVVRPSEGDRQAPQEDDRGSDRPTSRDAEAASAFTGSPAAPGRPEVTERRAVPQSRPTEEAAHDRRHERAVVLLSALRRTDDRLTLSRRDVNRLAPAVTAWFDAGSTAAVVHHALTTGLPADMRHPAAVLDYRLRELLPAPLPAISAPPDAHVARHPHPFQTCDGCERAFRAPHSGRCRDCRSASESPTPVVPLQAA
ncbi:helix-turn-helix domain-containing protein [Streptomyces sp. WAC 01325]|uniref:helix-turn-helix domain-containing protein n=1 Tax=Streptomyces sp. WAC 01325 TaxID=2203202 RepID=UPI000F8708C9|nr:helix-turn-helix domain-containing protein [Streptomyces sp. WAC 01325]RSN07918.1 helix-turn-helix domain-containing protein [Streptomyces sp. WAC 01325]